MTDKTWLYIILVALLISINFGYWTDHNNLVLFEIGMALTAIIFLLMKILDEVKK